MWNMREEKGQLVENLLQFSDGGGWASGMQRQEKRCEQIYSVFQSVWFEPVPGQYAIGISTCDVVGSDIMENFYHRCQLSFFHEIWDRISWNLWDENGKFFTFSAKLFRWKVNSRTFSTAGARRKNGKPINQNVHWNSIWISFKWLILILMAMPPTQIKRKEEANCGIKISFEGSFSFYSQRHPQIYFYQQPQLKWFMNFRHDFIIYVFCVELFFACFCCCGGISHVDECDLSEWNPSTSFRVGENAHKLQLVQIN